MKRVYSVAEAQTCLSEIVDAGQLVRISQNKKIVGFYIPRSKLDSWLETAEMFANPEAMKAILGRVEVGTPFA
jgi:PHD/YefM family antitoxin component YafN of YafNO toxin-antitoxin module